MSKSQNKALAEFFGGFGISAYPTSGIPQDPVLPYITYQPCSGYWGDVNNITVQLWMRTESEAAVNAKVKAIGDAIGAYTVLPCDGGCLQVSRGTPWCIPADAQDEPMLKLRQMNVRIEHLTNL